MRRTIAAASLALASALLVASPSAAYAASYLDEAVQALQTGNVYVSVETQTIDAATKERLEQQTKDTNIGVVILPEGARTEAGDLPQFVDRIAFESNKETVVVAIGNDLEASGDNASKLANDLERSNSSTGDAVVKFVTEVRSAKPAESPQTNAGPDFSGIGITAAVIVALGAAGYGLWRSQRKRKSRAPVGWEQEEVEIPEKIQDLLTEIQTFNIKDPQMRESLERASDDTRELFERLTRKKSNRIQEITQTYVGLLQAVRKMLVTYVDIQKKPQYYQPDTERYLRDGQHAAAQYANGVLKNVQEVERGALTDFRVDIKVITSANTPDDPIIH